jgi:hypothetical protein
VSGFEGVATEAGAHRTTILPPSRIAILGPNQNFITDKLTNYLYLRQAVRLRVPLPDRYPAVLGPALLAEYEDVPSRDDLFAGSVPSAKERNEVFDGFLNRCRWIEVFHAWRPNLPDEADDHLIELAVAAQAEAIVMPNLRDVSRGELKFPSLRIMTPEQCPEVFPCLP